MSLFLGKIHYWLFNKVLWFQGLEDEIIEFAKTKGLDIDNLKSLEVIDDVSRYYLLSESDLISMGLEKVDYDSGYIVNYETEEIIYVKGFRNDGNIY